VNRDTGGLVDYEQVLILEYKRQRPLLVLEWFLLRRQLVLDRLTAAQAFALTRLETVHENLAVGEHSHSQRSRADLGHGRKDAIEPLAC
jgi:hypothetical protein